jgi:nucleoside-diphosphate-sugar epimerase
MRILVTGATGYAGSRIAAALSRDGHTVLGLTRSSAGERSLEAIEVTPALGDLARPDSWRDHLRDADAVVHAVLDLGDPVGSDQRLFTELLAAQEADGRRRHLVYTTGISAYGRTGLPLVDETTPGNPESPLHFRFRLERELADSGLGHTIVRPGFLYGGAAGTSMLGQWFAGGSSFYGDTTKRWSWVHVEDLADAYTAILRDPARFDGETFVLADDQRLRAIDVQREALRAAGHTGEVSLEDAEAGGMMQVAADQDELVTSAKAHRLLGWRPRHLSPTDAIDVHFRAWRAAQPVG